MSVVPRGADLAVRGAIACGHTRLAELFGSGEPGAGRSVALMTPAGAAQLVWADGGAQAVEVEVEVEVAARDDGTLALLRLLMLRSTGISPAAIRRESEWDGLLANWAGAYADTLFGRARAAGVRHGNAQQLSHMALEVRNLVIAHEVVNAADAELREPAGLAWPSPGLPDLVRWWAAGRWLMGRVVPLDSLGGGDLRCGLRETAARHEGFRADLVDRLPDLEAFDRHVRTLHALAQARVLEAKS